MRFRWGFACGYVASDYHSIRSQPPTAAAAVKSQPAKSGSNTGGPSIQFGSINHASSGPSSTPTPAVANPAPSGGAPPANIPAATAEKPTFGSIVASKPEETQSATPTPVVQEQAPQQTNVPAQQPPQEQPHHKPASQHMPQPHVAHHNSHRRTDSSSSHSNEAGHHHYYRGQAPPMSQPGMMPAIVSAGPPTFAPQRPPLKNQAGMGMGMHGGPHPHGMMPQQGQWQAQGYYPMYDPNYYQQPMYTMPYRPMPAARFNPAATPFTPPAPQASRRIAIINPDTKTEVRPTSSASSSSTETKSRPVVIDVKHPEVEKKDIVTPPPAKSVIKIVDPRDKERLEREAKEKEERERKEREEKERLEREAKEKEERERKEREEQERLEAERKRKEEEEERRRKEEEERLERERKEREEQERIEAERKRKEAEEEEERKRKEEEEERKRKEEEERKRKVEEEERLERERKEREERELKEREEQERLEKERVEKEKAEKERLEKLEADRRIAEETEKLAAKVRQEKEAEEAAAAKKSEANGAPADSVKPGLTVDISRTSSAPASSMSARIENFSAVNYPAHIQSPHQSEDAQGKYKYDRNFLMQFMSVCTDRPESLPSLEALGMDEAAGRNQAAGGLQRGPSRGSAPARGGKANFTMGAFKLGDRPAMVGGMSSLPMGGRVLSNDGFQTQRMNRTPSDNQFMARGGQLSRPPSQRGSRGGKKGGQGRGGDHGRQNMEANLTIPIENIVPLAKTDNAWVPQVAAPKAAATEEIMPQDVVSRKVKGLLNKLTPDNFDSISAKVVEIANQSKMESDGATLRHCLQIIFEKATDEPSFVSVYAQLCHRMMETISEDVKDVNVTTNKGEAIVGGHLFRKYLLNRCQEDFVKGWKDKATVSGVSLNDKDGPDLMSDEYYVMMKAKRQGLGLIRFIGELFKLGMLTERIMHNCVKQLLNNVKDPEEEETEGLCKLMTTIGARLDRPEAKGYMDVYFLRMVELTKNDKLPSRIRFMVQDVIDLRKNKWVDRRAVQGPKKTADIRKEAQKELEEKEREKEAMRRTASSGGGRGLPNRREQMSRGNSFRGSGDARNEMGGGGVPQVGSDGWSTVSTPLVNRKVGDLSSFGKTSRSKAGISSLGPGAGANVFGSLSMGKNRSSDKAAGQNESKISSTNIFAALEGDSGDRRGSIDADKPAQRPRLNLLPRSASRQPEEEESKMTKEQAQRRIDTTFKEYQSLRDSSELVTSFKEIDSSFRSLFVTELVTKGMESKQADVDTMCEIFKKLAGEGLLSKDDFEAGFTDPLEILPDVAIDAPNAFKLTAQLLEAAGLDPSRAKAE
ncbi:hypothetical protein DFQ26_004258 [Actinomortierella ambigua]|nr:hypothetical protein DFQ26_004258 [Actinomortierella ambigua]